MNRALLRAGLRWHRRHLVQTLLLLLGVALGVSLVVGIDIANASADRSFRLSTTSLTGKATHQIVGGGTSISDTLISFIRRETGHRRSAPVLEGVLTLEGAQARQLRLLGVDPYAEGPFRGYAGLLQDRASFAGGAFAAFLLVPGAVAVGEDLATELRVGPGDTLRLRRGTRSLAMPVVAVLRTDDPLERRSLRGMLVADIATAQEILDLPGRLSHIDLIVDGDTAAALTRLRETLPAGVRIESAGRRSSAISSMTDAFSLNLTALSLLALVVGMFLIYDTVSFSVVQRREQFGVLRAIGASRTQIAAMVLGETLLLASIGTAGGLVLGVLLGQGALNLVTQTISDLYFSVTVTEVTVSAWSLAKGAALGIGGALLAALLPAREAMTAPPAGAVRRALLEDRIRRLLPRFAVGGLLLLLAGALIVIIPHRNVALSFGAVLLVLLGAALLSPVTIRAAMNVFVRMRRLLPGVTAVMAARNISRSLSRTSVAIAALMIAVSVIVGVNTMIASFRQTVDQWLELSLGADIFVSVPFTGAGMNEGMPPALRDRIAAFPGVERVVTARPLSLQSERYGPLQLVAASGDVAKQRPYKWTRMPRERVWPALHDGAVLLSEPFAYRHGIEQGRDGTVTLLTDSGYKEFDIAGVFYDYSSDKGTVLMSDRVYRAHWRDTLVGSVAAYVMPGTDVDATVAAMQRALGDASNVLVQSNRGLRATALSIFDRTFTITLALQLLAGIVAFIGVFSALMALQLERGREIATLRATGMSRTQLARLILTETGLMGAVSGALALPVGLAMALMLVYVINLRSFGWTLQLTLDPMDFVLAFGVAVGAALLAGIYPALRFAQTDIRRALREE